MAIRGRPRKVVKEDLPRETSEEQQTLQTIRRWIEDPLAWILDVFGDNIKQEFRRLTGCDSQTRTGLTVQQEAAFTEAGKVIRAKIMARDKATMTEKQKEYAEKIGLSIQSGTGTGKDTFTSLLIAYFMCCFPKCKVTATAPTSKQLKNVLWSEIAKVMGLSRKMDKSDPASPTLLQNLFEWQAEKVFLKAFKGKIWFAEAVTINAKGSESEQAEALGGRHEIFQLLVVDEASGVPNGVFKPLEGTLTGVINLVLLIFNPTKSTGFAVESQKDKRFVAIRWNAEESEIVGKSHIKTMEEKYGRDSNTYRIRVLGLPPLADDDSLIPWDWIEDARTREIEPLKEDYLVKACDFGAGGDLSVICTRKGGKIFPFKRNKTKDSNTLTDWVYSNFLNDEANLLLGDSIGIGWAIMGNLRQKLGGYRVRSVDSRGKAYDDTRFYNKRAEAYWALRTAFENKEISLAALNDEDYRDLINQLGATKYNTESGRIQIIKKSKIKETLGSDTSPDEADSFAIAYSLPQQALRQAKPSLLDKYRRGQRDNRPKTSWMAV